MCKCVVVVLSGGIGTRFGDNNVPKQYREIGGMPIITRVLKVYERSEYIDQIVVVAESCWHDFIISEIREHSISKFFSFAVPGRSRTESMCSGFKSIADTMHYDDFVMIQDAARPFVTNDMISRCFLACKNMNCDGAVVSSDEIEGYFIRNNTNYLLEFVDDKLICVQSPDCYKWGKYSKIIFDSSAAEQAASRGCQQIAINHNLKVLPVGGGGRYNPKITTQEDLLYCEELLMSHFSSK